MNSIGKWLLPLLLFGGFAVLFLLAMVLGGQASPGIVVGVVAGLACVGYLAFKLRGVRRKKA